MPIGLGALGKAGCVLANRAALEKEIELEHPALRRTSPDEPPVLPWVLSAAGYALEPWNIAVGGAGAAAALTAYHLATRFALKRVARAAGAQLPFKSNIARFSLAVGGGVLDFVVVSAMFKFGLRLDFALSATEAGVDANKMTADWEAFQSGLSAQLGDSAIHQMRTQLDAFIYFYRQLGLPAEAFCRMASSNWSVANEDRLAWMPLYMILPLSTLSYLFLPLQARCIISFVQLQMLLVIQNQTRARPVLGDIAMEVRADVGRLGIDLDA